MNQHSTVIGMDLGDKVNRFCVLDTAGEVVQEGSVRCTESELRSMFETPTAYRDPMPPTCRGT